MTSEPQSAPSNPIWLYLAWALLYLAPMGLGHTLFDNKSRGKPPVLAGLVVLGGAYFFLGAHDALPASDSAREAIGISLVAAFVLGAGLAVHDNFARARARNPKPATRAQPASTVPLSIAVGPASWTNDEDGTRVSLGQPKKARILIRYLDAEKQSSERIVRVEEIWGVPDASRPQVRGFEAHCEMRRGRRTFRLERITEAAVAETGEVIRDLPAWLLARC